MIGTVKKPFPEILAALEGFQKIGVVGCDGCAKICLTGGADQIAALAQELKGQGKEIVFEAIPERTCSVAKAKLVLEPLKGKIQKADALIVLGCGSGVQIAHYLTQCFGITISIKSGVNFAGYIDTTDLGQVTEEQRQEWGDCLHDETGGISPVTKCAKGLLNGPCGGSEKGKCEVDPERDCAWVLI